MKSVLKILRDSLPEAVGAIIATAVISIFSIVTRDLYSNYWVAILVVVGVIWVGCFHFAFKRAKSNVLQPTTPRKPIRAPWKYPRGRRWALVGLVFIPLLAAGGFAYYLYQLAQPPSKVLILVADFDGPEPKRYRVSETILINLKKQLEPYKDIQVRALGQTITEAEGSEAAIELGRQDKASIVIWGWYGATGETVPLSVHFELLRSSPDKAVVCPAAQGQIKTFAQHELDSFTLQTKLSDELAYLSLFTVGMAHYQSGNWKGAIGYLENARNQASDWMGFAPPINLYYYLGNAHYNMKNYADAISNYDKAISIDPNLVKALYNRAELRSETKNYDDAIADFSRVIQIQEAKAAQQLTNSTGSNKVTVWIEYPGRPCLYNNRGVAYLGKNDYKAAASDFEKAIQLESKYPLFRYNRGRAYNELGDYQTSLQSYNDALGLDPQFSDVYYQRGIAQFNLKNNEAAINDFTSCIAGTPKITEVNDYKAACYGWRGFVCQVSGDKQKAIDDYRINLQYEPDASDRESTEKTLRSLGVEP